MLDKSYQLLNKGPIRALVLIMALAMAFLCYVGSGVDLRLIQAH